tara:strand:- start:1426 stop:1590 length:165 start_codon:yes stop_codon:yes gene_type:complete
MLFGNWKDKRIDAIQKMIRNPGVKNTAKFMCEYTYIIGSEAKNKKEYKQERKNK